MRDGGKDAAANETRGGQRDIETEDGDEDEDVSAVFVAVWCSNECSASEQDVDL